MKKRIAVRLGLGVIALLALSGGGWILSLPPMPAASAGAPVARLETEASLAALRPPKRQRPLIAIVGINDGTETTDYLMPYGILRRADVADVVALATNPGPVTLYPALTVQPQATIAEFDARHPRGADYVIVPAMRRTDDPAVLNWIRAQAASGAIVIGVCAGATIVANAGLLDGRRATTHWYYLDDMRDAHPAIRYVADRRFVIDRGVATTTGITASMPMMITLIEAIAGRDRAEAVARDLGLASWDPRHDSGAFLFSRPFALTIIGNQISFWNHERLGIELSSNIDEVSLALVADAWSRTYRSRAILYSANADPRPSRNGLLIFPDEVRGDWPAGQQLPYGPRQRPAAALDFTLGEIGRRFGGATRDVVAAQLEYAQGQVQRAVPQ